MGSGVDEQSHLTGALDFAGQKTLMMRAGAGDATGNDLAAFGHEITQDVGTLVIQGQILVSAEAAELAALEKLIVLVRTAGLALTISTKSHLDDSSI